MDLLDADLEEGFSFIWTIQNYDLCFRKNKDICYESPTFELDENSNEKWSFKLQPKRMFCHDNVGYKIQRSVKVKRRKIKLDVSISDVKGSYKRVSTNTINFSNGSRLIDYLDLILNKKVLETYPNNDSLTIKFKIFELVDEVLKTRQCYARTIIGAERIFYPCTLEGFEEIENGTRIEESIIIFSELPFFKVVFSSTGEIYAKDKIEIKINPIEPNKEFYSTCEISSIDADGGIAHSVRDECNFETSSPEQVWTFPFIEVSKLLGNKKLYLPNGVFHLSCEFVVSSGVVYNKVERTQYGIGKNLLLQCSDQTTDSDVTESLKDNLQRFYEDGKFSDLAIQTPSKEFRVHKSILCARSEVFSAMFERDMKENLTGVVEIEDIDDDTISKMLLFLYTDSVGEDLEFRTAFSLYFAADKYQIVALKRNCSNFLKGNFTITNVCDVLVLADMHQDQELKSAAQKFIFEHSGEIMKSEEWPKLMQNNLQLASVTMCLFIQNLNN